jgi:hypothetical protein
MLSAFSTKERDVIRIQWLTVGLTLMLWGTAPGIPLPIPALSTSPPTPLKKSGQPSHVVVLTGSSTGMSSPDTGKGVASDPTGQEIWSESPQQIPTTPNPIQAKPPVLVPDIPEHENGHAVGIYKSKKEETQALLETVPEHELTKEQHDTYISIRSFLEKAQEAFAQDDMSMAVNLVEKAHTLAREIAKNSGKP